MSTLSQFFSSERVNISPNLNISVKGNIIGLGYERTGPNEITIAKGVCKDSSGKYDLILPNDFALTIPNTADTSFYFFLCDDSTVKADTDHNGTNIPNAKRWVGFCRTKSSGEVYDCVLSHFDDYVIFRETFTMGSYRAANTRYHHASTTIDLATIIEVNLIKSAYVTSNKVSGGGQPWGNYVTTIDADGFKMQHSGDGTQQIANIYDGLITAHFYQGSGNGHGGAWNGAAFIKKLGLRR